MILCRMLRISESRMIHFICWIIGIPLKPKKTNIQHYCRQEPGISLPTIGHDNNHFWSCFEIGATGKGCENQEGCGCQRRRSTQGENAG